MKHPNEEAAENENIVADKTVIGDCDLDGTLCVTGGEDYDNKDEKEQPDAETTRKGDTRSGPSLEGVPIDKGWAWVILAGK